MLATVKIFQSGNSQAIRLPKAFRFDSSVREIQLRKNETTGVLTFSPVDAEAQRRARIEAIFEELRTQPALGDDWLPPRNDVKRNPFAETNAELYPPADSAPV